MTDLIRLLRLFAPYRMWMLGGVALGAAVILANVALLALSGWFITSMALSGLGLMSFSFFAPAAAIRGLALLRTGARYLERLVTHEATLRLLAELRVWFYRHLEPLAPARLQDWRGGDLLSRIRADIDSLDNLYLRIVAPVLAAGVTGIVIVAALGLVSPGVALVDGAGLILAGVALPLATLALGRGPGARVAGVRARLQAAVADTCRGLAELTMAGALPRQRDHVVAMGDRLVADQRRGAWTGAAGSALSGLVAQVAMWLALVVAIPAVAAGALSGPQLAMLALGVAASFEAVAALPAALYAFGETAAAARRIFEIIDATPAVTPPLAGPAPARFDIAFEGVTMAYGTGRPVFEGLDLEVAEGEALALVGPSGAGKTTVLNLVQRFWAPEAGRITLGGLDLQAIPEGALRDAICIVAQRTHLFNATIRDNLLLARPGAPDEALMAALEAAGMAAEVRAMPRGLDTRVGEVGTRLSGGQARRVAIARAFLRDAPILILDEPTEGLDVASERIVLDALARLKAGRTVLLISHRPQALALADRTLRLPAR